METSAVIMMIVAIVLVWGGLGVALIHLRRNPDPPDDDDAEVADPSAPPAG